MLLHGRGRHRELAEPDEHGCHVARHEPATSGVPTVDGAVGSGKNERLFPLSLDSGNRLWRQAWVRLLGDAMPGSRWSFRGFAS